jgi:CHAT domain-containing protein
VVRPLLTKADVVHSATHALQDYDKENASPGLDLPSGALMLPPSKNLTNGLLSSRDIYQHVVTNARLVNFSACSSGIGNRAGLDQLMKGLAHSFLVARSQSVLYSLWDVPDAATYALMRDFYQLWYRQGLSRPVALQRAMLNVRNRREYASHFFWGACKLVGTSFQDIR